MITTLGLQMLPRTLAAMLGVRGSSARMDSTQANRICSKQRTQRHKARGCATCESDEATTKSISSGHVTCRYMAAHIPPLGVLTRALILLMPA